jgi:histidinol phosphatase-like enzyme (inositol monophosphatase family)
MIAPMPHDHAPAADPGLLDEAVSLCRAAGDLTLRWFRSVELAVEHKQDGTPVTEADKGAERFLRDEIDTRHPNDAVIGEEWADSTGTSGRTWVIDPIDGTKSFTHGVPLYSNLLAVYDEHGPLVGVINLPALGETVYAGRGLGCFIDGRPAHVNDLADLSHGSVCTSGLRTWDTAQLSNVLGCGAIVRTWGDGYGFGLVATGRTEVMADPAVSLWDIAPVPVIIREAGGRYTDFEGNEALTLDAGAVVSGVATNGVLHDEVLDLLRAHRRDGAGSRPDLHD